MAKLNILGAISTGLIEGGKAAQTYGAMKLKEEYMAEEKQAAAAAATSDKQKFLIEQVDKHRGKILDSLKSGNPLSGTISLDGGLRDVLTKNLQLLGEAETVLVNLYMGGKGNSPEAQDAINTIMGAIDETNKILNTDSEGSGVDLFGDTTDEGFVRNFVKFLDTEVFKFEPENVMEFMKTLNSLAGSSDILSDTIAEVNSEFPNATEKQIASEVFNRMMSGDYGKGNPNDNQGARGSEVPLSDAQSQMNRIPSGSGIDMPLAAGGEGGLLGEEQVERGPYMLDSDTGYEQKGPYMLDSDAGETKNLPYPLDTAVDPQASEQGLISAAETNTENFSEYRNKTRRESLLKLIANPKTSDKDRKEAEKILSEMGEVISAEEQAYEDARNKAALGGTGATSADMTQEQMDALSRETDRQAAIQQQGYIGSDEAIESLYAVGGPIGEPATTDILARANVKKESPEIESTKSRIIASLTDLILQAESGNDTINNKFNAVSRNREDPNLTNMTIGEIVDKYGNDAVGAGQFKYKEFTKPMAKKYLRMEEEELKQQVFTRQFQLDMIALGLEDAGLTKIAKGDLSPEKFQKRIANVWRGMPPTKETQIGDPTDELGNKARVSGARYQQHLYNYRNL